MAANVGSKEYINPTTGERSVRTTATDIIRIWTGAGTTNAPTTGVPMGAIGFNSDGASTGNVYVYDLDNTTWRDTTQTVAGFFGV